MKTIVSNILAAGVIGFSASAAELFTDEYDNNSIANYTQIDQGGTHSWSVADGKLTYTNNDSSWNTSMLLSNSNILSTHDSVVIGGDITVNDSGSVRSQPSLVFGAETTTTSGSGYQIFFHDDTNEWRLLRNPVDNSSSNYDLKADDGALSGDNEIVLGSGGGNGAYHIEVAFGRSGDDTNISVLIQSSLLAEDITALQTYTGDVLNNFGGDQFGWRYRTNGGGVTSDFDNLTVSTAVPEPASATLLLCGAAALLMRRRSRN